MVIWVIKAFLIYFFCVFLPVFIFSASVRALLFLFFIVPILAWNVPLISPILWKKHLVFPILLFCSTSLHCAFKNDLSHLAILWNSTFSWVYLYLYPLLSASLLSSAVCQASSDNQLLSFLFLCEGFCHCPLSNIWTSVYNSSGTLSTRSHPLNLFITSTV